MSQTLSIHHGRCQPNEEGAGTHRGQSLEGLSCANDTPETSGHWQWRRVKWPRSMGQEGDSTGARRRAVRRPELFRLRSDGEEALSLSYLTMKRIVVASWALSLPRQCLRDQVPAFTSEHYPIDRSTPHEILMCISTMNSSRRRCDFWHPKNSPTSSSSMCWMNPCTCPWATVEVRPLRA